MTKIEIINAKLRRDDSWRAYAPKLFYKYRTFDEYTLDMLENEYLYVCKASSLDDETECNTKIDLDLYLSKDRDERLTALTIASLFNSLKGYVKKEHLDEVGPILMMCMNSDGTFNNRMLIDASLDIQNEYGVRLDSFINEVTNAKSFFKNEENKERIENQLLMMMNAKEVTGVCSLATTPDNEQLWKNYAGDYSGYCVEYELDDDAYNDLFPVIYVSKEERNEDLLNAIIKDSMHTLVNTFKQDSSKLADTTSTIRLVLTKYDKWKYQDEWRLIAQPGSFYKKVKIKRIYVGHNLSSVNLEILNRFCANRNVEIIRE